MSQLLMMECHRGGLNRLKTLVLPTPSYLKGKQSTQTTAVTAGRRTQALRIDGKSSRLFTNIMANKISTFTA